MGDIACLSIDLFACPCRNDFATYAILADVAGKQTKHWRLLCLQTLGKDPARFSEQQDELAQKAVHEMSIYIHIYIYTHIYIYILLAQVSERCQSISKHATTKPIQDVVADSHWCLMQPRYPGKHFPSIPPTAKSATRAFCMCPWPLLSDRFRS